MGYIINVNSESKQALALLEIAKTFDFIEIKRVKTTRTKKSATLSQKEKFKKRIVENLEQVELLKKGKLQTRTLDDFLNEL